METREISPEQWHEFLDQFSRLHEGKNVRMETVGPEFGIQANSQTLSLLGITSEHASARAGGSEHPVIEIMTGDPSGRQISHVIDRPASVRMAEWNDGYSAALEIKSEDGSSAIVRVGPAEELLPADMITDGVILDGQQ